ncbi:nucleotide exchange factor GrpE [Candidatus Riflebacteria bacterium]
MTEEENGQQGLTTEFYKRLNQQIIQKDNLIKLLQLQVKNLKKKIEAESADSKDEELISRIQEKEDEISRLREEREGIEKAREQVEREKKEQEDANKSLADVNEELTAKLQEKDSALGEKDSEIQAKNDTISELERNLEELKAGGDTVSAGEFDSLKTELEEEKQKNQELVDKVASLESTNVEEFEKLQKALKEKEEHVEHLTGEIKTMEQEVTGKEGDADTQKKLDELASSLTAKESELEELNKSHQEIQEELEKLKGEADTSIQEELSQIKAENEKLISDKEALEKQLQEAGKGEISQDELNALTEKLSTMQIDFAELNEKSENLENENQEYQEKISQLEEEAAKVSELETQISKLQEQMESVQQAEDTVSSEELKKERERCAELKAELARLKEEGPKAVVTVASDGMKGDAQTYIGQLIDIFNELDAVIAEKDDLPQEVSNIHDRLRQSLMLPEHIVEISVIGEIYLDSRHEAVTYYRSAEFEEGLVVEEKDKGYLAGKDVVKKSKVGIIYNSLACISCDAEAEASDVFCSRCGSKLVAPDGVEFGSLPEFSASPDLYILLGTGLLGKDNRTGAQNYFIKAIDLAPERIDAWKALGSLYYKDQNYQQAIEAYKKVAELDSTDEESATVLAELERKSAIIDEIKSGDLKFEDDELEKLKALMRS